MGKKAKFKKIRRLASQMPVITTQHIQGEIVKGSELDGVKVIDELPVQDEKLYKKKSVVSLPLNHNRKMKALYNKHGVAGVNMYIGAVNAFVNKKKEAV